MAISTAKGGCNDRTKPELTKTDHRTALMVGVEARQLQVVRADDDLWPLLVVELDELLPAVFSSHG